MRYELLVAAAFVRAGFDVAPEDESDSSRSQPEFVATHCETKFTIAVEAKARSRRPTDRNPERAGIGATGMDATGRAKSGRKAEASIARKLYRSDG
jgi:hypothetical protein